MQIYFQLQSDLSDKSAKAVPVRTLSFGRLHLLHLLHLPRKIARRTRRTASVPKERCHEHRRYHCIDGTAQQFHFFGISSGLIEFDTQYYRYRCTILIDIAYHFVSASMEAT